EGSARSTRSLHAACERSLRAAASEAGGRRYGWIMSAPGRSKDVPDTRNSNQIVCRHAWVRHGDPGDSWGCICVFMRCEDCGVMRKLARCRMHSARAQDTRSSREYYSEVFDDGIPQNTSYAMELTTALRDMGAPPFPRGGSVLEVGC